MADTGEEGKERCRRGGRNEEKESLSETGKGGEAGKQAEESDLVVALHHSAGLTRVGIDGDGGGWSVYQLLLFVFINHISTSGVLCTCIHARLLNS